MGGGGGGGGEPEGGREKEKEAMAALKSDLLSEQDELENAAGAEEGEFVKASPTLSPVMQGTA